MRTEAMDDHRNYYEILEVGRNAASDEIKKAYKKKARAAHPDCHPDNKEEARKEFNKINEAYEILSDVQKKQEYDNYLSQDTQSPNSNSAKENDSTRSPNANATHDPDGRTTNFQQAEELQRALRQYLEEQQRKKDLGRELANKAREGDWNAVISLISQGAYLDELDDQGFSALHYAVMNKDIQRVQALLQLKANINVRSTFNETPLYLAVSNNNHVVVKYLLENNAELYHRESQYKYTALHLAIYTNKNGDIVKLLIENNRNRYQWGLWTYFVLDSQNFKGNTPLHLAIFKKQYGHAIALIQNGADVNIRNQQGATAKALIFNAYIEEPQNHHLEQLYRLSSQQPTKQDSGCFIM